MAKSARSPFALLSFCCCVSSDAARRAGDGASEGGASSADDMSRLLMRLGVIGKSRCAGQQPPVRQLADPEPAVGGRRRRRPLPTPLSVHWVEETPLSSRASSADAAKLLLLGRRWWQWRCRSPHVGCDYSLRRSTVPLLQERYCLPMQRHTLYRCSDPSTVGANATVRSIAMAVAAARCQNPSVFFLIACVAARCGALKADASARTGCYAAGGTASRVSCAVTHHGGLPVRHRAHPGAVDVPQPRLPDPAQPDLAAAEELHADGDRNVERSCADQRVLNAAGREPGRHSHSEGEAAGAEQLAPVALGPVDVDERSVCG